jgi:hypothetical protein
MTGEEKAPPLSNMNCSDALPDNTLPILFLSHCYGHFWGCDRRVQTARAESRRLDFHEFRYSDRLWKNLYNDVCASAAWLG